MVTLEQAKQQLQTAKAQIEAEQQRIATTTLPPQTRAQLMQRTMQQRAQVREQERLLSLQKARAVKQLQQYQEQTVTPYAQQITTHEQQLAAFQREKREWEVARNLAWKQINIAQLPSGIRQKVQQIYSGVVEPWEERAAMMKELGQLDLKPVMRDGRVIGFEDIRAGMSYRLEELPAYRPQIELERLQKAGLIELQEMKPETRVSPFATDDPFRRMTLVPRPYPLPFTPGQVRPTPLLGPLPPQLQPVARPISPTERILFRITQPIREIGRRGKEIIYDKPYYEGATPMEVVGLPITVPRRAVRMVARGVVEPILEQRGWTGIESVIPEYEVPMKVTIGGKQMMTVPELRERVFTPAHIATGLEIGGEAAMISTYPTDLWIAGIAGAGMERVAEAKTSTEMYLGLAETALAVGVLGAKALKYIPRKKYAGMTTVKWRRYQKMLKEGRERYARAELEKAKLWGERLKLTKGEVGKGLPATIKTTPWESTGLGVKSMSKREITALADDLVKLKVYSTKKAALSAIQDVAKYKRTIETQLPSYLKIMKGKLYDVPRVVKLPAVPSMPTLGRVKTDIFGISAGTKTTKEGARTLQLLYQLRKGRPTGRELQVVQIPPRARFAEITTFVKGRRGVKGIRAGDMYFKGYTFEPYRMVERKIVDIGKITTKKVKDIVFREYKPVYREVYLKPKRVLASEIYEKWLKMPTRKELAAGYQKGLTVERQFIKEAIIPRRKGELVAEFMKVRYDPFPTLIYDVKLGARVKEYWQVTKGVSLGEIPIKRMVFDVPTKFKPTPFVTTTGKELKLIIKFRAPTLFPTKLKAKFAPPVFKAVTVEIPRDYPRMVGGVGALSLFAGKGIYEKPFVGGIQRREELTGVRPIGVTKVAPRMALAAIPVVKEIQMLKPAVALRPAIALKPAQALRPVQMLRPAQMLKPALALKPALKLKTQLRLRSQVVTKPTPTLRTALRVKPIIPKIPPPIIIPTPKLKPRKSLITKKRMRPAKGFEVFVRRRGKPVKVSPRAIPKGEALWIGRKVAKTTAAAQFWIVPTRVKKVKPLGVPKITEKALKPEFRKPVRRGVEIAKPFVWIQRRPFRIKTPGELREITYLGIRARRRR